MRNAWHPLDPPDPTRRTSEREAAATITAITAPHDIGLAVVGLRPGWLIGLSSSRRSVSCTVLCAAAAAVAAAAEEEETGHRFQLLRRNRWTDRIAYEWPRGWPLRRSRPFPCRAHPSERQQIDRVERRLGLAIRTGRSPQTDGRTDGQTDRQTHE